MSTLKRRCCYAGLLIGWAIVLTIVNPMGQPARTGISQYVWPFTWSGAYCSLPFLSAAWIALGVQPAIRRIPMALALAAFFVLLALMGQRPDMRDELTMPVFMLVALGIHALTLAIARKWLRWRVGIPGIVREKGDNQFAIVTILAWTAVVAGLLGFAKWIVGDWNQALQFFTFRVLVEGLAIMAVYSLFLLPVAIAATGAVLADWPRRRFIGWLIALFLSYSIVFSSILYFIIIGGGGPAEEEAEAAAAIPPLMLSGVITAILATCGVLRICGFRLWRKAGGARIATGNGVA